MFIKGVFPRTLEKWGVCFEIWLSSQREACIGIGVRIFGENKAVNNDLYKHYEKFIFCFTCFVCAPTLHNRLISKLAPPVMLTCNE